MILCSASCTSTLFLVIVQSSFRSIWSRSLYIALSAANSGSCASPPGRFLSVIFLFLSSAVPPFSCAVPAGPEPEPRPEGEGAGDADEEKRDV